MSKWEKQIIRLSNEAVNRAKKDRRKDWMKQNSVTLIFNVLNFLVAVGALIVGIVALNR